MFAPPLHALRQLALVVLVVELRVHAVGGAFPRQDLVVFLDDERIFHPVGDGAAAFGDVHAGVVGVGFAGRAGLAAGIVRSEPRGEPQWLLRAAEVLVVPARPAGCRRDEADRLVVDALDEMALAVLPRIDAGMLRPRVGVALALDADEDGGRGVGVRLGVATVLVL